MFQKLLRIYSYLFAIASSVAYLALGLAPRLLGTPLSLDNMPWKGEELSNWLLGLGALGFASVAAAASGSRLRFLLPIYSVIQLYITIKGNFLGAHSFDGASDFPTDACDERRLSGGGIGELAAVEGDPGRC